MAIHDTADDSKGSGPIRDRYEKLLHVRRPFLDRARIYSELTVPYLIPPEGFNDSDSLPTPYQSVGSMGVNTLASKLVLSVFPTSSPFFRLDVDDNTEDELKAFAEEAGVSAENISAEIRENLAKTERVAMKWLEGTDLRVIAGILMKHLIVGGNYLLQCDTSLKEPIVRGFRMDQYVVHRAPNGKVLEIIIKEMVDPENLSADIMEEAQIDPAEYTNGADNGTLGLYTRMKFEHKSKKYLVTQELNGLELTVSQGSYPEKRFPFLPLTWEREQGENYGRSYIEQLVGDLYSCEGLSKALYDGAAASAKVVFLVNPNGVTKKKTIVDAKNCDVITGDAKDVEALMVNKMNDFQMAKAQLDDIVRRLNAAFISQTAVQRNAERVTAEEIRMMAEMLDQQLGGVYARFSKELQDPLAVITLKGLEKSGRIPPIPQDSLRVQIITGIDALGRGQELQALRGAVSDVSKLFGPEAVMQLMHGNELVSRIFYGYGAKPEGVVKTSEELQAEAQAAQQAQQQEQAMMLAAKAAPAVIEGSQAQAQTGQA